jgi:hypothetical protein
MFIHRLQNPRAMKNVDKTSLAVGDNDVLSVEGKQQGREAFFLPLVF